ncbi:MAG: OmpA family protein [Octadecabacter sp.]|nr:OmpA family protein [Octadecabacter sp.]
MIRLAALLCLLPCLAGAVTLDMPANAVLRADEVSNPDSYAMPTGPWSPAGIPVLNATGQVQQQAWRISAAGVTTLQVLQPLRAQLEADGYDILFSCADDACGGFDFRFGTTVLPAPAMHVDLGDYRYLAASRRVDGQSELVSLLVSRTSQAGYVQVIRVGAPDDTAMAQPAAATLRAENAAPSGDLASALEQTGRFILSDLAFETGSAQLGDATFASLEALADHLRANPDLTVALVGHTDSVGSLEGNIALSKRRAGSVLERLATAYGIPRRQMEAEGMGYLSPLAPNLTEEGREANRRVEVIVTSTE